MPYILNMNCQIYIMFTMCDNNMPQAIYMYVLSNTSEKLLQMLTPRTCLELKPCIVLSNIFLFHLKFGTSYYCNGGINSTGPVTFSSYFLTFFPGTFWIAGTFFFPLFFPVAFFPTIGTMCTTFPCILLHRNVQCCSSVPTNDVNVRHTVQRMVIVRWPVNISEYEFLMTINSSCIHNLTLTYSVLMYVIRLT